MRIRNNLPAIFPQSDEARNNGRNINSLHACSSVPKTDALPGCATPRVPFSVLFGRSNGKR